MASPSSARTEQCAEVLNDERRTNIFWPHANTEQYGIEMRWRRKCSTKTRKNWVRSTRCQFTSRASPLLFAVLKMLARNWRGNRLLPRHRTYQPKHVQAHVKIARRTRNSIITSNINQPANRPTSANKLPGTHESSATQPILSTEFIVHSILLFCHAVSQHVSLLRWTKMI